MSRPLEGRRALVTGASRGTGRAIALAFAEAGADVALAGRSAEDLSQAASEVEALGRRAEVVIADIQDAAQAASMVDRAIAALGGLDILVNNAGGAGAYVEGGTAGLLDTSIAAWDGLFALNVRGPFVAAQAAGRAMAAQGAGVIINVTSVHGLFTRSTYHGYSAAKAALHELTAMWAVELGEYGVRVNEIAPGIILAGRNGGRLMTSEAARKDREGLVPLGRIGMPDDIAPLAVFLASDAASYINGATIAVSGGWRGDMAPAPRRGPLSDQAAG